MTHALSLLGGILLIASIILTKEQHFPGKQALIPVIATVFIIMAGKDGIINKYLLSNKVLVWFGLISYPMYLWHWPLLSMARIVRMEEPTIWYRLLAFPICILLAWLTTKLIENPLRFGRYGKTKTIMLFLMMVGVGFCGYRAFKTKGFPKRFPKEIQVLQETLIKFENSNTGFYDTLGKRNPCHSFNEESDFNECRRIENSSFNPRKQIIAIWGDSHATHLIPGLRQYFGNQFNIMQRSGGGCPAMGNQRKPICQKNTSLIIKDIIKTKPWLVILAARWDAYSENINHLTEVIHQLKKSNINNIILIGSVPSYKNPLPKELIKSYLRNGQYPERIKKIQPFSKTTDEKMATLAKNINIPYYSTYQLLCNKDGCETMADNNPEKVLSFDDTHLTEAGSLYLVKRLKNDLGFLNHQ